MACNNTFIILEFYRLKVQHNSHGFHQSSGFIRALVLSRGSKGDFISLSFPVLRHNLLPLSKSAMFYLSDPFFFFQLLHLPNLGKGLPFYKPKSSHWVQPANLRESAQFKVLNIVVFVKSLF